MPEARANSTGAGLARSKRQRRGRVDIDLKQHKPAAATGAVSLLVRILSVNTHKGFTPFNRRFILPELREAVRTTAADVVFLQEVLGTHAKHARRFLDWPEVPQYEFLAETIWPDFAYGRNAVYPNGHHGNALLSKYPIIEYENLDVSVSEAEKRGLLHCVLRLPYRGSEMHVICVHFGLTEGHRRAQTRLLCERLRSRVPDGVPLVVAGDFNDWRLQVHTALAGDSGLREAFVDLQDRLPKTFPARWPLLRLDRVYLRNAVARRAEVLSTRPWSHLSDHAPLAVELAL
jgi:endonuclease/exonuclease/phosphatase family metal-dependent hydrolase